MTFEPEPQDIQAAFAHVLVDEWARAGVRDIVTCPGSRSTPLLVAVGQAAEQGSVRLHVLMDERAAGFFALGLGLASGRPAPVVTTSGTAAVELHPAVVEAHHAGVPFIAVTADRPGELHDCGAPQTVDQDNLFGPVLRWRVAPGVPQLAAARSWRSLASRSVAEARGGLRPPGPVHLNLAFREPLMGSADAVLGPALAGRAGNAPWHRLSGPADLVPADDVVSMLASAGPRGLIVAGRGAIGSGLPGTPDAAAGSSAVHALSQALCWPVLADPLSGCRQNGVISMADPLLRGRVVRGWKPEIVLRLGAPWASRVLNEWLAELTCPQVLADPWGLWQAPDRLPGEVVAVPPPSLCRAVAAVANGVQDGAAAHQPGAPGRTGPWWRQWSMAEKLAQGAVDAALEGEDNLTEPGVARTLVSALPNGSALVMSSSMPVRDVEWWSRPRGEISFFANRGANGIDGFLSTAFGIASARAGRPTAAVVGDLAFLYDASALLGAVQRGVELDVVVVDNDGGGIFNFLPQAADQPSERFERLWGTPHGADLAAVARGYGASVEEVPDLKWLSCELASGGPGQGVRVLVARTDRAANVTVHRRLQSAVEAALQGLA